MCAMLRNLLLLFQVLQKEGLGGREREREREREAALNDTPVVLFKLLNLFLGYILCMKRRTWMDAFLTAVGEAFVWRSCKVVCNLGAIGNVSDWFDVTCRSVICQCIRPRATMKSTSTTWKCSHETAVWNVSSQSCDAGCHTQVHNTTFVPWWASKWQWKGFHFAVFICQYEQMFAISERVTYRCVLDSASLW